MIASSSVAGIEDSATIERSLEDGAAFAELFDRYYQLLYRFLRGRVGPDRAEDLASEVFAVAFRRRASYDLSRPDARPWLYGIAINLLRGHRREERRRLRAYERAAVGEGDSELAGELGEQFDPVLAGALADLSFDERTLLLLFSWADLSYEQIAEAVGSPVGTVRSRLSRTRAKLQSALRPPDAPAFELKGRPADD
jgi:RNA polymerase sigma factor (sigma-70 family)